MKIEFNNPFRRIVPLEYHEETANGAVLQLKHSDPDIVAAFVEIFHKNNADILERISELEDGPEKKPKKRPIGFRPNEESHVDADTDTELGPEPRNEEDYDDE